jgi:acid phosphatase (class A)
MKSIFLFVLLYTMVVAFAPATAGDASEPQGYLSPGAVDILKILPPAPAQGEARYESDRAIFKATRRFIGSARWALATNDVKLSAADMLSDFSCAVGVTMTIETSPRLVRLMTMARTDTARASNTAKDYFKRQRPYQIDDGQTCQAASELANSYDYPSGHTTAGWTWALLLAEIAPDQASAILARGRAFGESRIVCGVHNATAVQAGQLTAVSVLAVMHAVPNFQSDLKAAKEELAALRAGPRTLRPQECADLAKLLAQPVF